MRRRSAFFSSLMALILGSIAFAGNTPPPPAGVTGTTSTQQPSAASVVVVQATVSNAIALGSIATSHLSVPITLEERNGGVAKGLTVRIDPSPNANGTPLTFTPAQNVTLPADLGAAGTLSGTLTADLPKAGEYGWTLRLVYDGKPQGVYTVSLTRAAEAAPPAPTALSLDPGELPDLRTDIVPGRAQPVVATTTLTPTGAEAITVAQPTLRSFVIKETDSNPGVPGAALDVTDDHGKKIAFPITLRPGEVQPLRLTVTGVKGSGKYEAKIQFTSPGHTALSKSFVISAREGRWIAFLCVLIGVALSHILRRWMTHRRPRLALELRAAAIDAELEAAKTQAQKERTALDVIAALQDETADAWRHAISTQKWGDAAPFDLLDHKVKVLRNWISMTQYTAAAQPPSVRDAVAADLIAAQQFLRTPGGAEGDMTTQDKVLAAIPGKLRTALVAEVQNRLKTIDEQLKTLEQRPKLDVEIRDVVRPRMKEVKDGLGANDLERALAASEVLRKEYAKVLTAAITDDLRRATPKLVDQAVWDGLKARLLLPLATVAQAQTADDAMATFEAALADYTRTVAATLIVKAENEKPRDDDRKKVLDAAIATLSGVDRKVLDGKLFEAWNDVALTHASLAEYDPRTESTLGDATAPARPRSFATEESLRAATATDAAPKSYVYRPWPKVKHELTLGDVVADLAAILIATAIGVGAVWNNSPTWGGFDKELEAVLWGLGVHQISYNGLSSIFEKFK